MKRLFFFILLLLTLFSAGIYLFIPSVISVSVYSNLPVSASGVFRIVTNIETWKEWFPHQDYAENIKHSPVRGYVYQNDTFTLQKASYNSIKINICNQSGIQPTQLIFIPVFEDSLVLNWKYTIKSSPNPFIRLAQYRQAIVIKRCMDNILMSLEKYCSMPKNVYGISITETSTADTLLVFKSIIMKSLPSVDVIYQQIHSLQLYTKEKGAKQTSHPMINIIDLGNKSYRLMTALPTDRILSGTREIVYKRMIPGRFLTTTVTGGENQIRKATQQIQQYIDDYQRIVMAEPFQILITDRTEETDSSKWKTKLFFPVK